jgi:osmoprotectant transport system ATP-binding protein
LRIRGPLLAGHCMQRKYMIIALENISKRFADVVALAPLKYAFRPSATTVLIGPSGCGKSTVLRLLVGLVKPDSGRVIANDVALTDANVQEWRHRVGYVIQEGGLFPHLDCRDNVLLLARYLRRDDSWMAQRLSELTELVHLPPECLDRYPQQLSGGQRQRVALLRALLLDPQVLFLDEPFGALDPMTRHALQGDLKNVFAQLNKTVVMVTHDMNEAAHFADQILLMRNGVVLQSGPPEELQTRPADPFVTEFIRAQRGWPSRFH